MDVSGINTAAQAVESTGASDKQLFGAQVVTKTLDYMNSDQNGSTDSDYDFQKSVLGAAFTDKGTLTNIKT